MEGGMDGWEDVEDGLNGRRGGWIGGCAEDELAGIRGGQMGG